MERKLLFFKSIILGFAFITTIAMTFISVDAEQENERFTTFEATKIPVLYMKTKEGKLINPAYGYVTDVGERNIFTGITPLYEERDLNVSFYSYGASIRQISYQIRDIENNQLLEDTVVKNTEIKEDYVNATLNIKNLIEKDKEYFLTFTISTDTHETIKYYSRIKWQDDLKTDEKINFVLTFNGYTYNKEQLSNISKWIETNETGDNTNFGRVNIYSTRSQIGWGNLAARVEGNVIPVIWELTPTNAQIGLTYRVVTSSSSTEYEAYNVKDYYRLRQTSDTIYLMDYEREADQIFDAYNDLQSGARVNLGIKSELGEVEALADTTGKYSYFVQNGSLWCYYRGNNKFTNVFSFVNAENSSGRQTEDAYEIKIISVDANGNAWFSVCGHMNGGKHDGEMGVSLFNYNYEENVVKESVFIPVNIPYNLMKDNVADVSYVNGDHYYIKINQYLYSIDLISGEYMLITDKLFDNTYAVNESGTKIAYHESHTVETNKVIRIYDFQSGTEKVITGRNYGSGSDTDYLKIVGYIGNDLIYGMARQEDIIADNTMYSIFPMYNMVVLDDEYYVVKRYCIEGSYVYAAEIDGMRVNLWRVVKNEEGEYEETSIDQLMNKQANSSSRNIYTEVVTTSAREKELYLNMPTTAADLDNVEIRYTKEIHFLDKIDFTPENDYQFANEYMVYGAGEWIGKFSNLRKAISTAAGCYGMVMDLNGEYVWKKTEGNTPVTWDPKNVAFDLNKYTHSLVGVSLENVIYYLSTGKVVAARMGEDKFVYIYDYDNKNIIYYDTELERDVTLDRETASKKFIQWDNIFLVLE